MSRSPRAAAGGTVIPLINCGQTFDGVTFEGIPDGLGVVARRQGRRYVDIYVAFEQSHVPFDADAAGPQPAFADFEDSSVQRARLDLQTMQLTNSMRSSRRPPDSSGSARPSWPARTKDSPATRSSSTKSRTTSSRAGRSAVRGGSIDHALPPGRAISVAINTDETGARTESRSSDGSTTRTRSSFQAAGTDRRSSPATTRSPRRRPSSTWHRPRARRRS